MTTCCMCGVFTDKTRENQRLVLPGVQIALMLFFYHKTQKCEHLSKKWERLISLVSGLRETNLTQFIRITRKRPSVRQVTPPPSTSVFYHHGEAACRVCVTECIWRGGVIRFPRLIFCFSPLVSRNSAGRAAARRDHQRRQQDETQEGACSPNIWQGQGFHDSLRGLSDLRGSKRALGA